METTARYSKEAREHIFGPTFELMSTKWSSRCLMVFSNPTSAWTWKEQEEVLDFYSIRNKNTFFFFVDYWKRMKEINRKKNNMTWSEVYNQTAESTQVCIKSIGQSIKLSVSGSATSKYVSVNILTVGPTRRLVFVYGLSETTKVH